jgi:hypothetical protein
MIRYNEQVRSTSQPEGMNHQQNIRNGELGPFTCSLSLHFIKNQNHEKRGLEKEHISLSIDIYIYIYRSIENA